MQRIITNSVRYMGLFADAIDKLMPAPRSNVEQEEIDRFQIQMQQRRFNMEQRAQGENKQIAGVNVPDNQHFPKELERKF